MSEEPRRDGRRLPIRWVTLAEAVALAAVLISALGLYNSWKEDAPAPAAEAKPAAAMPLTLRATVEDEGRRLVLAPADGDQVIQSQTITFPPALGVGAAETTGNPRIEAGWIDGALAKAEGDAKPGAGDRRLPVLVTTRWIEQGTERSEASLYQLGYALTDGGLFGGRHVRLRGLSLTARGVKDGEARLARWQPAAK